MMAKINHFCNEARDGTNDHFHLTPSRLFGIGMKIVRHFFLQVSNDYINLSEYLNCQIII